MNTVVKSVKLGQELVLEDGTRIVVGKNTGKVSRQSGYVVLIIKRYGDIGKILVRKELKGDVNGNVKQKGELYE